MEIEDQSGRSQIIRKKGEEKEEEDSILSFICVNITFFITIFQFISIYYTYKHCPILK